MIGSKKMKRFIIKTLGCKANQYDSQVLKEKLLRRGLKEISDGEKADLCVVNTCTVTEQSDAKSRQAIRNLIRKNPEARIVVTGCYVDRDAQALENIVGVDCVASNDEKAILVEKIFHDGKEDGAIGTDSKITFFSDHTRAFVKIQDGCDKFCSYCIIPFVRGKSRSRKIEDIVEEVKNLTKNDYKEIVLTGIHIGSFGVEEDGKHKLPELIDALDKIPELRRLRLSSIDPKEVTEELIDAVRNSCVACHHFHISLQSGSDKILERMNRDYTAAEYLDIIEKIKNKIRDVSISTDVMVGFPGETEEDFFASIQLVEKIEFSKVHIFPYSRREGTASAEFNDKIDPKIVKKRIAHLTEVTKDAAIEHRKKFLNSTMEVLIENKTTDGKNYQGFTDNYLKTIVPCSSNQKENLNNKIVPVRIIDCDDKYLFGEFD